VDVCAKLRWWTLGLFLLDLNGNTGSGLPNISIFPPPLKKKKKKKRKAISVSLKFKKKIVLLAYGAFGAGYGGIIPSQVRPPGGYGVPYTATPYDAFASSLYTGGPGSIGYGGAPTASGGSRSSSLAVPYAGQSYPGYPPGGYTGYGSDNLGTTRQLGSARETNDVSLQHP